MMILVECPGDAVRTDDEVPLLTAQDRLVALAIHSLSGPTGHGRPAWQVLSQFLGSDPQHRREEVGELPTHLCCRHGLQLLFELLRGQRGKTKKATLGIVVEVT